jgi:hypothetical protein
VHRIGAYRLTSPDCPLLEPIMTNTQLDDPGLAVTEISTT